MKCIETRKRQGYTYRRYELADGTYLPTYEITDPTVSKAAIVTLIRQARRNNTGAKNLLHGFRKPTDPDKIDRILADIENPELKVREVCDMHGISTKTYYKIMKGM